MLKFFIILAIAMGCYADPSSEEPSNPPEFVDRTPVSTADQIPTSTPVGAAEEDPEETKLERPSEPEIDPEEEKEGDSKSEEEEPEPEQKEEDNNDKDDEDDEEEDIVNTLPTRFAHPCFSYFDCPNHEACNVISSTCYSCTEGWQCNNKHDLRRASHPSFCCTQEAFDEEKCDLIGTCKE